MPKSSLMSWSNKLRNHRSLLPKLPKTTLMPNKQPSLKLPTTPKMRPKKQSQQLRKRSPSLNLKNQTMKMMIVRKLPILLRLKERKRWSKMLRKKQPLRSLLFHQTRNWSPSTARPKSLQMMMKRRKLPQLLQTRSDFKCKELLPCYLRYKYLDIINICISII